MFYSSGLVATTNVLGNDVTKSNPLDPERTASTSNNPFKRRRLSRKPTWREIEKTILAGLTLHYFSLNHSLKESRTIPRDLILSDETTVSIAWKRIAKQYEKVRLRWNELKNDNLIHRTGKALARKWKDTGMKSGTIDFLVSEHQELPESSRRYHEFFRVHNKDFILTCNEIKFQELINNRRSE